MNLRRWHRTSALLIASFAAAHLANHLVSLAGVAAHQAFLEAARRIYRQPALEALLLACVAFQLGSGLWSVLARWRERRGAVAWLQAGSGLYLALFLAIHVGAVLYGRSALGLDTNFHFAAAGFHVGAYVWFFAPYYFLAVLALFTHLGCALYWQLPRQPLGAVAWPMAAGGVLALLLVLSLAGRFAPVDVPARYKATYLAGSTAP